MVTYQTRRLQGSKPLIIRLVRWERYAARQKKIFNLICIITNRIKKRDYPKGINFQRLPETHINREKHPAGRDGVPLFLMFLNATVYKEEEEGSRRFQLLSFRLCLLHLQRFPNFHIIYT